MTADSPHLELLWRHLDGEPLDASEAATLDAALAADPVLHEMSELHRQTRSLIHGLPVESAPAALIPAITKGIATPATVAKVILFGLPLPRFALVATLLLAVLGGAFVFQPGPLTHEEALIREHLASNKNGLEFHTQMYDRSPPGTHRAIGGLQVPRMALVGEDHRDCSVVDCPATQTWLNFADGTHVSLFVVKFATHFDLASHAVDAPGLNREYGVLTKWNTTMIAWEHEGMVFALVTKKPAAELIAFVQAYEPAVVFTQSPYAIASLKGHTIQ